MNQEDLTIKVFKALGHPVRFNIIKFLYNGPKCVCKLNEEFQYSQANLSQHLRILKDAGLVKSEKVGLETHYRLYDDKIKTVIDNVESYVTNLYPNSPSK